MALFAEGLFAEGLFADGLFAGSAAPVLSALVISDVQPGGTYDLTADVDTDSTIYYARTLATAPEPTRDEIELGGGDVLARGTYSATVGTGLTIANDESAPAGSYRVWAYARAQNRESSVLVTDAFTVGAIAGISLSATSGAPDSTLTITVTGGNNSEPFTIGGQAFAPEGYVSGVASFTVPQLETFGGGLPYGSPLAIEATINGQALSENFTVTAPAGWQVLDITAIDPTGLFGNDAQGDPTLTANDIGDQVVFYKDSGIGTQILYSDGDIAALTDESVYNWRRLDRSASAWGPLFQSIVDLSAAPVFSGTIPDQSLNQGVAMTPIDLSQFFSGVTAYSLASGTLPSGLSLAGGVISGTPTQPDLGDVVFRGVNGDGSVESNAVEFLVTAAPDVEAPTISSIDVQSVGIVSVSVIITASDNSGAYRLTVIAVAPGSAQATVDQIVAGQDDSDQSVPTASVGAINGPSGVLLSGLNPNTVYDIQYAVIDASGNAAAVGTLDNNGAGYRTIAIGGAGGGSGARRRYKQRKNRLDQ